MSQVHWKVRRSGADSLGSDSHTPTGGESVCWRLEPANDVAVAMGGGPYMMMPKVCRVVLKGALKPWVTAKDNS